MKCILVPFTRIININRCGYPPKWDFIVSKIVIAETCYTHYRFIHRRKYSAMCQELQSLSCKLCW